MWKKVLIILAVLVLGLIGWVLFDTQKPIDEADLSTDPNIRATQVPIKSSTLGAEVVEIRDGEILIKTGRIESGKRKEYEKIVKLEDGGVVYEKNGTTTVPLGTQDFAEIFAVGDRIVVYMKGYQFNQSEIEASKIEIIVGQVESTQ